ncbi:hypothetical protein ACFLY2_00580 [Patescibacteria group bacterium]
MKKIVYYILFILFFIISGNVFALENEYNTESNIKKAILVEDYITKHKFKIEEFIKKYEINNDILFSKDINELNESIYALQKIQNTDVKKEVAEDIMRAVLVRIKNINDSLKVKLKAEKEKIERKLKAKKKLYSEL